MKLISWFQPDNVSGRTVLCTAQADLLEAATHRDSHIEIRFASGTKFKMRNDLGRDFWEAWSERKGGLLGEYDAQGNKLNG